MKRGLLLILLLIGCLSIPTFAGDWSPASPLSPSSTLDSYEIYYGPTMYAYLGDPAMFIPIRISTNRPVTHIYLLINYDPQIFTPTLLAPNVFVQKFVYDISTAGVIKLEVITDLPPPPDVPSINGDMIFAWISCEVTIQDIGYDYLTHLEFVEDPLTPRPDNFIVLDNNEIIANPPLVLTTGDVLVVHPLYGDINIDGFPYSIADAVYFINFFMGYNPLSRRQYANSDCNRDEVQATIADLVYMLRIINGDTILSVPPQLIPPADAAFQPLEASLDMAKRLDNHQQCDIFVDGQQPLGGATFMMEFNGNELSPEAVLLDPAAGYMQVFSSVQANKLKVTVVNWDGSPATFKGGRLFSIIYSGNSNSEEPFGIVSADFSDNEGKSIAADYRFDGYSEMPVKSQGVNGITLAGYPNPFNSSVSISFNIPQDGRYQLNVYDILGRRVKTLLNGFQFAGHQSVVWDGSDDNEANVASGTYFLRLKGDGGARNIRLFMLK